MRRYLALVLLICLPALASAKSGTSLYICAHPDDCFLFMSPNLYDDVTKDATKVVVVYLTSGDDGLPFSEEDPSSYPLVRENASLDATEWMADAGKKPITSAVETEVEPINGHNIDRISYGNTVSYFMRLPDGNMYGDGFELYNHESLRKLKTGEIDRITPINNEAAYHGWQDVVTTLSGIISHETEGEAKVTLHIQDPDTKLNTTDHTDHTTTGSGALEALALHLGDEPNRCYTVYKHIDYSIAAKEANLTGLALASKSGSFAVLTATQRHFLTHEDWEEGHLSYIDRNYYTTMMLPEGCDKPH